MSKWNPDQPALDTVTELVNIGVGRAAAALSELIGERIELNIPSIRVFQGTESRPAIAALCRRPETVITQAFRGPICGRTSLYLSQASSVALAQLLSGTSHGAAELDAELSGILLEVGNIMMNGVMGALSNALSTVLTYSIPELQTAHRQDGIVLPDPLGENDVLVGDVRFRIMTHDIQGSMVVVFAQGTMEAMMAAVLDAAGV